MKRVVFRGDGKLNLGTPPTPFKFLVRQLLDDRDVTFSPVSSTPDICQRSSSFSARYCWLSCWIEAAPDKPAAPGDWGGGDIMGGVAW